MDASNFRILVVDDDAFIHNLVKMALDDSLEGEYQLQSAYDGAEAKSLFRRFKPNFVLTDIVMPDMDGFDLTIYLKTSDPAPYVVVMSGTTQDNLDTAKKLGPDRVFNKDVLFEQLPQAMEEFSHSMAC